MLQCICWVIGHGWSQDELSDALAYGLWPHHILTSSVIYHWTATQQNGIYLVNRCMAGNRGCMPQILHCHCSHHPFSDVNISTFSCYILNQIENSVPIISKKIMHSWGLEKLMNTPDFCLYTHWQFLYTLNVHHCLRKHWNNTFFMTISSSQNRHNTMLVVLIQHLIGHISRQRIYKKKEKAPSLLLLGRQQNAIILKARINKKIQKPALCKS